MIRSKMAAALVTNFEQSDSFATAKARVTNLEHVTAELADRVKRAAVESYEISHAFGVREKVARLVNMYSTGDI